MLLPPATCPEPPPPTQPPASPWTHPSSGAGAGRAGQARLPLPAPRSLRTPPCLEREEIPHWQLGRPAVLREAYGLRSYYSPHRFYWNKTKNGERFITKEEPQNRGQVPTAQELLCCSGLEAAQTHITPQHPARHPCPSPASVPLPPPTPNPVPPHRPLVPTAEGSTEPAGGSEAGAALPLREAR